MIILIIIRITLANTKTTIALHWLCLMLYLYSADTTSNTITTINRINMSVTYNGIASYLGIIHKMSKGS